jgi:hypothetical protein
MTTTDATYRKEICYDRETRDYAMYLDGELVGFARTYHEAEIALDQLVFELMSGQLFADLTPAEVQQDIRQTEADTRDAEADALASDEAPLLVEPDACEFCTKPAVWQIRACSTRDRYRDVTYYLACDDCYGCEFCDDEDNIDAWEAERIHPIDVTALLEEADVLLSQTASHPGPDCSCPDCTRAAERLIIDAFMTRLRFDAGVLCSFCGDEHADSACPQKRPLLAPRVCGNCGGQHSIQQCSDIRRLLFAA